MLDSCSTNALFLLQLPSVNVLNQSYLSSFSIYYLFTCDFNLLFLFVSFGSYSCFILFQYLLFFLLLNLVFSSHFLFSFSLYHTFPDFLLFAMWFLYFQSASNFAFRTGILVFVLTTCSFASAFVTILSFTCPFFYLKFHSPSPPLSRAYLLRLFIVVSVFFPNSSCPSSTLVLTSSHDAGQPQRTPLVGGDGVGGDCLAGVQSHADH